MFFITLLIAQVTAEWVEISQQHYTHRKPLWPHSRPFLEETTTNRYMNYSVTEFNWNHGVHRVSSSGNVKRVQLVRNAVQTSPIKINSQTQVTKISAITSDEKRAVPAKDAERVTEITVKSTNAKIKPYVETKKITAPNVDTRTDFTDDEEEVEEFKSDDKKIGTVNRVPNIGSVKRVQLANTPIKSPSLKLRPEPTVRTPTLDSEVLHPSHKPNSNWRESNRKPGFETAMDFNRDIEETNLDIANTKYKQDQITRDFNDDKKLDKNINSRIRPVIITSNRDYENYTRISKIPASELITGDGSSETTYFPTEINPLLDVEKHQKAFRTKEKNDSKSEKLASNNNKLKTNSKPLGDNKNEETNNQFNKESQSINEHVDEDSFEETANVKVNTLENVVKFLKVIADTISSNTRRGFGGKMRYLQELKDTILANIEDRIDSTWPDDVDVLGSAGSDTNRRRTRSTHATARGHVEFPSSEGALMTISFLTFAVFLIKLVLQVIHTYKNKAMMVAPLVVASAGRAAFRDRDRKPN